MRFKTSTRISLLFSIFTFFIIGIILILLNIFSFLGWYTDEKDEVFLKLDSLYERTIKEYDDFSEQKEKLMKNLEVSE